MRAIVQGNAAHIPLSDQAVHCTVTSPPYWSLRRYAGEQDLDWPAVEYTPMPGLPPITVDAWRGSLGLEPTPEMYIGHLVMVFREVFRVLRDDGVAWCNIGDSYSAASTHKGNNKRGPIDGKGTTKDWRGGDSGLDDGLQQGDLVGIPARLQLALQGSGWIVRQDVIWKKENPMPESISGSRWQRCRVKVGRSRATQYKPAGWDTREQSHDQLDGRYEDRQYEAQWQPCPGCPKCSATGGYVLRRGSWRHTRSHEVILMLAKRMHYFANGEIVRESVSGQGVGVTGIIQGSYLKNEIVHFLDYLRLENKAFIGSWPPPGFTDTSFSEAALFFARTILDFLESENNIGMRSLDEQIRIKLAQYLRCLFSSNGPAIHQLAVLCSAYSVGEMTTKQLIQELNRLRSNHRDTKMSEEGGAMMLPLESGQVNSNRNTAFSINYSSRISELLSSIHNEEYTTAAHTLSSGRNPRDVISLAGSNYSRAHYAVFPPDLIQPLVLATTPLRCCPECGAGWSPIVNKSDEVDPSHKRSRFDLGKTGISGNGRVQQGERYLSNVTGYRPSCDCGLDASSPGTVLDPFVGSGTVLAVARDLGLNAIGLDLSMTYLDEHAKIRGRIGAPSNALDDLPLFAELEAT